MRVVVDLVCFTLESATALAGRLRGEVGHLLHRGSIWRYGPSRKLPIAEGADSAEAPFDEYGIQKDRIARMLKEETAAGGLVTTPPHPATSSDRAGCRSARSGTSTRASGTRCRPVSRSRSPEAAPGRRTTCTPTTSPRRSSWPSTGGTRPPVRTSTSSPPPRSPSAATPSPPPGSARPRCWTRCRGRTSARPPRRSTGRLELAGPLKVQG